MSRTAIQNLATLGLNAGATKEEITKAYRRLAAQYHPDKNPDTAEQFQKIKTAYEDLTRPRTSTEVTEYVPPLPRTWQNTIERAKEFLYCAQFKNNQAEIKHWTHVVETAQAALESCNTETDIQTIEPYGFDFGNIQFEEFRRDFAQDVVRINGDATRPYLEWLEARRANALPSDLVYFNTPYFQRCILIAECMADTIPKTTPINLKQIRSLAIEPEPLQAEELNVLFLLALRTNRLAVIKFFLEDLKVDINNLVTVSYQPNAFYKQFFLISPLHFSFLDYINLETIIFYLLDHGADPNLPMRLSCGLELRTVPPLLLAVKASSRLFESYAFCLTEANYPEKNREIDILVSVLIQHGANSSILSRLPIPEDTSSIFPTPTGDLDPLYRRTGTKYRFTDNPVFEPFYAYVNLYSRTILEANAGLIETITSYTDIGRVHNSISKQQADIYFLHHQEQAIQYLHSIQKLLAEDHCLTITRHKSKISRSDILILLISPFASLLGLKDPRSKREKKLAEDSRQHCNGLIKCRMAFDQAITLMKAKKSGFEKYLAEALKQDKALFHNLTVNLLSQKGAYRELNLSEIPEIVKRICDLEIIRNTAKEKALALLAKISRQNEQTFIDDYLKPEHNTKTITEKLQDNTSKEDLLAAYEKLIQLRNNQIQALARLTAQTQEIQAKKTTRISSWHSSFWKALGDYHQDIKKSFAILDTKIRALPRSRSILSPYQPILKNMEFFNRYLVEAITGEKCHSFNRIAYCISFINSTDIHYDPSKKDLPIIELLKNLYSLKGLLLAETHSQSYLKNLFNCAMTSKLADHALNEIKKIETMLKRTRQMANQQIQSGNHTLNISNIDIDNTPEILAKRQELSELDKYYGTAWRRFKTALFSNKQKITEKINQQTIMRREQCISLSGSNNLFAKELNKTTIASTENQQQIPTLG